MRVMASTNGIERGEWLKLRQNGIGGSDAAAILGLNPYKSPLAVYADKRGLTNPRRTRNPCGRGEILKHM